MYVCTSVNKHHVCPHQVLEAKASSRTCHTAEEALRQIGYGLLSNEGLSPQAILVLVHSLVRDSVPRLSGKPHPPVVATVMHQSSPRRPEDSRLIAKEPGRARTKPATQSNAAAHVITEFGLQVYITYDCTLKYVYMCEGIGYVIWSMWIEK